MKAGEHRVWLLQGALGAGKSTFARAALRSLGVTGAVPSPTFTLVRQYRLRRGRWQRAIHVDAYRITSATEIRALAIDEAIADPACLVLIEWPERLPKNLWPTESATVRIRRHGDGRRVTVRTR